LTGRDALPRVPASQVQRSSDEDWFRGFAQEIEDFVGAIRDGREPRSGIDLAVECVNVIYAAYQSAETGCRVTLT